VATSAGGRPQTPQQRERAELAAAGCTTCRDRHLEGGREPKPCLECGELTAYYSCAPGYCSLCAHDPRWVSLWQVDAGEVSPL
jgi:hypothetical protein